MITIKDKNETYHSIDVDNEDDFIKIMDFFTIKIPGAEFMPSVKMGLSSGTQKFITPKGELLYGLKGKLISFCKSENIEVNDLTTVRASELTYKQFLKFVDMLDLPFPPYEHQLKGAFNAITNFRRILLSSTGSGKSLLIYIVMRYMIFKNYKTMLIVPTIDLVNQMFTDFEEYYSAKYNTLEHNYNSCTDDIEKESIKQELENILKRRELTKCLSIEESFARIFGGQDKHTNHICKISTYQSLSISQDRVDPEYFKGVDAVIIDECHKGSANGIQNILKASKYAKFKIGLTGSLSDNILENLKIEGAIGEVKKIISMREMIDLGLASEIVIKPIVLEYSTELRKEIKKMKYTEEDKFIRNYEPRAKFIAKLVNSLKGNTILIYKNIDCAELLLKEIVKGIDKDVDFKIKDYRKQNDLKVYYSQGNTKSTERNNFRKYLEEGDNCKLLGTTTIVATGLNIKNLPYTVFENIGKSSTLTIQGLGRGARLHKDKEKSVVFDIIDDARYYTRTGREYPNYKYKHWLERLDIYYANEYIVYEPVKVKLSTDII